MSFRIDLVMKDGVQIYLTVIRNHINIHFESVNGDKDEAFYTRENFTHLESHFVSELPNFLPAVRGEDPEHIKRHHLTNLDTSIVHTHTGFDIDVTPELLTNYLKSILSAQMEHSNEQQYQILNPYLVNYVIETFTSFYNKFSGSELQEQFLAERELTKFEKMSLAEHVRREGYLTEADQAEFKEGEIPPDLLELPRVKKEVNFENLLLYTFFGERENITIDLNDLLEGFFVPDMN